MKLSEANRKRLWAVYISALACWAINAYLLICEWFAHNQLFAMNVLGKPYVSDFTLWYEAGQLGREALAHALDVYDPKLQGDCIAKLIAPVVADQPFYLQYPPWFFTYMLPLSLFSLAVAWMLWCLLGIALISWALIYLCRGHIEGKKGVSFVFLSFFAAFPTWLSLRLGQTSLIIFPFMVAYWKLLREKRYFLLGLITGLLSIKIQYLPFLGMIGLVTGHLRFIAGGVLGLGLAILASAMTLGWSNVINYPQVLLHAETTVQYSGVSPEHMQNLRGILHLLLHGSDAGRTISAVACIVSALGLGYLWARVYPSIVLKEKYAFEICASISALTLLVFSLHTHAQDYIQVALPCIWLMSAALDGASNMSDGERRFMRAFVYSFSPLTWVFFLLTQLGPLVPIQPFATAAVLLIIAIFKIWFGKSKANPDAKSNVA